MADLTPTTESVQLEPQRPPEDVPIKPRSTTKLLTDDGIQEVHVDAEPLTETVDPLDAIMDAAEKAEVEEAPSSDEPTAPNFDTPEAQAFNDQFKQLVGVDLKTAYEQYTSMATAMQEQQAAMQQQQANVAVNALQEKWGVNEAEFNTRVEKVLAYTAKLSESDRAMFDSVDGIDRIWSRIGGKQSAPPISGGRQGGADSVQPKTFRKSELQDMMLNNPKLYSSMQAAIRNAYESGSVVDDI